MKQFAFLPLTILLLCLAAGCGSQEKEPSSTGKAGQAGPAGEPSAAAETPPMPPLNETFDGEPQLSLFPRVSAFRPEDTDQQGLSFWNTYIEHLAKTSGMAEKVGKEGSRAWAMRSLKGIDSVGFFSPLAVDPETSYRVTFSFRGEMPDNATAGIGILEFDEFLWVGEQYPESLLRRHQTAAREGARLKGEKEWRDHSFIFTTSPKTRMIHLILFRDGAEDREHHVFFDDIRIEKASAG